MKRLLMGLMLLAAPAVAADFEQLVDRTLPKVVLIQVRGIGETQVMFSSAPVVGPTGVGGSGAFISADGYILTCNHLFEHKMAFRTITVITSSGKKYKAELIAQDKAKDLALVKVNSVRTFSFFTMGKQPVRGQRVISFGAPLGIEKSVTFGYVGNVSLPAGKGNPTKLTMHSATINPGNSGGPLVTVDGQLVGVNVATFVVDMFTRAEAMHLAVSVHDINLFLGDK